MHNGSEVSFIISFFIMHSFKMSNCGENKKNELNFNFKNCDFPNFGNFFEKIKFFFVEQKLICLATWPVSQSIFSEFKEKNFLIVLNDKTKEYKCGVSFFLKKIIKNFF